jgi:hypothetical protein
MNLREHLSQCVYIISLNMYKCDNIIRPIISSLNIFALYNNSQVVYNLNMQLQSLYKKAKGRMRKRVGRGKVAITQYKVSQ